MNVREASERVIKAIDDVGEELLLDEYAQLLASLVDDLNVRLESVRFDLDEQAYDKGED